MSRSKEDLHSELVRAFDESCKKFVNYYPHLPTPFITCTRRTNEEQEQLYALGRTIPKTKKVTNARAGQSPHNFIPSFAFDIAFINIQKKLDWSPHLFKKFADIITSDFPSVVWGFDWNGNGVQDKNDFDRPHFELRAWKQLKEQKSVA